MRRRPHGPVARGVNSAGICRRKLRRDSGKSWLHGSDVSRLERTAEIRQRPGAASHRKNLQSTIVALDGPLPNGCKGNAILDMLGDNRIHEYLRVPCQIAKPRCQIDDVSDGCVVEAFVPAE